ncbi:hypothetical protein A9995_15415 [Erythrobacter sp. QSSC1-22B]|nr:hypothetical protein A9995_15415 [Erythrobacter sp. QSSC1-22B]
MEIKRRFSAVAHGLCRGRSQHPATRITGDRNPVRIATERSCIIADPANRCQTVIERRGMLMFGGLSVIDGYHDSL